MAKVVRQMQVLSVAIKAITKEFGLPVYANEVLENFKKPCFFVAVSSRMEPYTNNVVRKTLTIAFTYFPKDTDKNEITYLDVVDRIQLMFQTGIQVNDRYLHIESVEDDRVGEEHDILQLSLVIPFLEQVYKPVDDTAERIGEVAMTIRTTSNERVVEIWKTDIDETTT